MKTIRHSRYKVKQWRKKAPEIRFDVSEDIKDIRLDGFFSQIAPFAARLYDEVWPEWRQYRVILISVRVAELETMAQLNESYRNISEPTDVLTFPFYEDNGVFVPVLQCAPLLLGEIVLCPQIIFANAEAHGVTHRSEMALITFHSLLHLLAWDHDTPQKQAEMWSVQERFQAMFLNETNANKERA